ncbi:MAG TPA: 3-methyl-2-oxobutanoate hydroxymethyltransferase [Candidatus Binatia bacterium]|nr:3-methyl-2-oxobutanoate hydroxymethyltransferase [Candidatus Binatia bacterium]
MPMTITSLQDRKRRGERFAVLTAYDYTTARILAEAEIPVILVGDSLGQVMLGYPTTLPVTMEEMLHHARAVARAAPEQLLVGDMPFGAYHASDEDAIRNAARFLQAGMHAVKMEGGGRIAGLTRQLTERGIPVMGHLGLTPQFVNAFGGHRVQGREADAAARIESDALALEEAGAFAIVLEGMPRTLGASITGSLRIPTIGIGAGPDCDGQVLVVHDMLGLTRGPLAKFVKTFASLGDEAVAAAREFAAEVGSGSYPDDAHAYH